MSSPVPLPHLSALQPYKAPDAFAARHLLSANEACLGASPLAVEAGATAARTLDRYPDGSARALREAIATRYALDAERVICGAGSEELISLIVQAYAGPGREVLFSKYAFIKYALAAKAYGAIPVTAPERDFTSQVDALLAAVTSETRVLFLANPNNPTGTYLSASEVARLRTALRSDVLLVIDAAYAEYVEEHDYSDGLALAGASAGTLSLRTFSKIHGLAALRCGWGYGHADTISALHKVRGAFNVNAVAQAAARAALLDVPHEQRARAHNTRERAWLAEQLREAGIGVVPSVCNFLMLHFADGAACVGALGALQDQEVSVLPLTGYGLPQAMRVTVGTREQNEAVVAALCGVAA